MTSKSITLAVALATLVAALPAHAKKIDRTACRNPEANLFLPERSCGEAIPQTARPTYPQPAQQKRDWRTEIFDNTINSGGDGGGGGGGAGGSY